MATLLRAEMAAVVRQMLVLQADARARIRYLEQLVPEEQVA